jgi:hypothetical protein
MNHWDPDVTDGQAIVKWGAPQDKPFEYLNAITQPKRTP